MNMEATEAVLTPDFNVFFGFSKTDKVTATRNGMLQINNGLFQTGRMSGKGYAAVTLSTGNVVGVHRIIYAAFNPHSLELFHQGCRINIVRPFPFREGTNMARNYLEDLIMEPLSLRPERPLLQETECLHPAGYGSIIFAAPFPVMYKDKMDRIVPVPNYVVEFYDSISTPCLIYHEGSKFPLRLGVDSITVNISRNKKTIPVHNVILSSAFPNIDVSFRNTVDHINNDCTDHRITNLQWLTRSENSAKIPSSERGGRPIVMLKPSGDEFIEVCQFKSQYEAARLIRKYLPDAGTVKCISSKISRNITQKPLYRPYNFVWRDIPDYIEGEEWSPLPDFLGVVADAYQVSNKGRVKNIFGYLFRPVPNRHGKYTSVSLLLSRNSQETKRFYVHFLVFCTFNNRIPEGDVRHNDMAPLINGYYRNYVEDLSDGTRAVNMYEYNQAKRNRLSTITQQGPQNNDVYDIEDVMSEKATTLFNENTFHQRGWVYNELEDKVRKMYDGDEQRIQVEIIKIRNSKILKLRRDYPLDMDFYKESGGKGCMFTTTAFGNGLVKGPCNQGISANVKLVHLIYSYQQLVKSLNIDISELLEELSQDMNEVETLDRIFHIKGSRGANVINAMLMEKGYLPESGSIIHAVKNKVFNIL